MVFFFCIRIRSSRRPSLYSVYIYIFTWLNLSQAGAATYKVRDEDASCKFEFKYTHQTDSEGINVSARSDKVKKKCIYIYIDFVERVQNKMQSTRDCVRTTLVLRRSLKRFVVAGLAILMCLRSTGERALFPFAIHVVWCGKYTTI